MQYELSSEVEKVANKVIKAYHPDLSSKRINYLIVDKKDSDGVSVAKWSKGHQIAAEIKVLSGDAAFLISGEDRTDDNGPDSVVVLKVYRNPWQHIKEDKTREALIDSQLCRLIYDDETGKPSIMEYDAKVHNSNLKRYGAWNQEIEKLFEATKELPLFAEQDKKAPRAGNGKDVPTINIYTDRKCTKCGKMESTDSGLCLKCAAAKATASLKDEVADKRRAATAAVKG